MAGKKTEARDQKKLAKTLADLPDPRLPKTADNLGNMWQEKKLKPEIKKAKTLADLLGPRLPKSVRFFASTRDKRKSVACVWQPV